MTAQPKTDIATREEYETPANEARPAHSDGGLLAVIERVALNPDVDIARMEALLKMRAEEEDRQRRIEREDREEQARREYLTAMSMVQAEIKPILRNKKNDHTKSLYADLASIERVVTPILTSHGFSTETAPVKCDVAGHIRVRLTISHSGGHERSYEDDFPLDGAGSKGNTNKTDIQAKGSTQTYGRRYLKASALDLSFVDDNDGNAVAPSAPISEAQYEELRALIDETGADVRKACAHLQIEALADLPAARFDAAKKALLAKKAKAAKDAEGGGE